ncbi:MAG: hypothetical protein ABR921_16250 [Candidatus Sulfotelmatobacter sp.]
MKTQAWAWLTAGVVALGLNGFYHDGGAAWAHRIAERVSDRSDFVVRNGILPCVDGSGRVPEQNGPEPDQIRADENSPL